MATTEAVATTSPPTDPPTTPAPTVPATTVPDVEAIKAQIAADYVRASALRDEWTRKPDARRPVIGAQRRSRLPGALDYEGLVALIRELVERGERVVPGEPDLNAVTVGARRDLARRLDHGDRRACIVFNDRRVGPTGETVGDTGIAERASGFDSRSSCTANGWLPASPYEVVPAREGVTTCPAGLMIAVLAALVAVAADASHVQLHQTDV